MTGSQRRLVGGSLLPHTALLIILVVLVAVMGSGCQVRGASTAPKQGSPPVVSEDIAGDEASATDAGPVETGAEPTATNKETPVATPTVEPSPTSTPSTNPGATASPATDPGSPPASARSIGPTPGALAPDLTLPDLNGDEVTLSGLRGKPVLLNFWASW